MTSLFEFNTTVYYLFDLTTRTQLKEKRIWNAINYIIPHLLHSKDILSCLQILT